jgi:hypothetical protein
MRTIRKGDKGEAVKVCQQRLNSQGFGPLATDGIFGEKTKQAVIQFQQSSNLTADGIVGDKTWTILQSTGVIKTPESLLLDDKEVLKKLAEKHSTEPDALKVILCAIDDLEKREVPMGSNAGPQIAHIVDGYNEYWGINDNVKRPWCAMAVSYWLKAGLEVNTWEEIPYKKRLGGCSQILNWARQHDCLHIHNTPRVEPGAIFLMPRAGSGSDGSTSPRAGHTGLVVADDPHDSTKVITIEGNTSNMVKSRHRKKSTFSAMGFVYWWDVKRFTHG